MRQYRLGGWASKSHTKNFDIEGNLSKRSKPSQAKSIRGKEMAAKSGDAPSLGEPETDIVVSDNGTGVRKCIV